MRALTMVSLCAVLTVSAVAQNRYYLYDGTTEFTSRGGVITSSDARLMQRQPGDQICGSNTINQFVAILQDQNITTVENVTFELIASDPTQVAAGGAPDINPTASGGIGTFATAGPFALTFPTPASGVISAAGWTITFNPAIVLSALPIPLGNGTPAGDYYMSVRVPANTAWPNDGVSEHISTSSGTVNPGEQMNPNTLNTYRLLAGQSGIAWQQDATLATGAVSQSAPNRVYLSSVRIVEDVCQSFAQNATAFTGTNSGLTANYGLAGIWPMIDRVDANSLPIPDNIGWRVRATAPAGYSSVLLLSLGSLPPFQLAGVGGSLCIDLNALVFDIPTSLALLSSTTQAVGTNVNSPAPFPGEPTTTSEAVFTQLFGLLPAGAGAGLQGLNVYGQAFTYDPNTFIGNLSTMCTVRF